LRKVLEGSMPRLYVRGTNTENVTSKDLYEIFGKHGKVTNVKTGQAGFAFVEMDNENECGDAISALHGSTFDGQRILVERARGDEFKCYNCNKPGHLARDCKEKPRNPLYADTRGTRLEDMHRSSYHPYPRRGGDSSRDRYEDRGRRSPQRYYGGDYSPERGRGPRGPPRSPPERRSAPGPSRRSPERGRLPPPRPRSPEGRRLPPPRPRSPDRRGPPIERRGPPMMDRRPQSPDRRGPPPDRRPEDRRGDYREPREYREYRDMRDFRDYREPRDYRDVREYREPRDYRI